MKYYLKRKCCLEIESGGNGARGLAATGELLRLWKISALSTLCLCTQLAGGQNFFSSMFCLLPIELPVSRVLLLIFLRVVYLYDFSLSHI